MNGCAGALRRGEHGDGTGSRDAHSVTGLLSGIAYVRKSLCDEESWRLAALVAARAEGT